MSYSTGHKEDADNERFFDTARNYPLLSFEDEKQVDQAKWRARNQLLQFFVKDSYCRAYLQQWAHELAQAAPHLQDFGSRRAYLALRREQAELRSTPAKRRTLTAMAGQLAAKRYSKALQLSTDTLFDDLKLPAVLVAGMAEHLMRLEVCSETGLGLKQWAHTWHSGTGGRAKAIQANHLKQIQQALADYEKARNTLVSHNLRLVFANARKLTSPYTSYMDRVQSGVLGLIRAAEKFESAKGYKFSTYAYSWINQAIRRSFEDQQGVVRYPSDITEQISKMYRARADFVNSHEREPSEQELAKLLQIKPESLFRLCQITDLGISIDSPTGDDDNDFSLAEKLSVDTFNAPHAEAEQASLNRCLMDSLGQLSEQEQNVVDLRWGLNKGRPLTRKELSVQLNMSQERIRQIENNALRKLRNDKNVIEQYTNGAHAHSQP